MQTIIPDQLSPIIQETPSFERIWAVTAVDADGGKEVVVAMGTRMRCEQVRLQEQWESPSKQMRIIRWL